MLRCRRWAANTLLGRVFSPHSSLLSKNVEATQRYRLHGLCLVHLRGPSLGRVLSTATNDDKPIAVRKSVTPDRALSSLQTLRDILTGKRSFNASLLHVSYGASKSHLAYITSSEFSTLIALFGALSAYQASSDIPPAPTFSLSPAQRSLLLTVSTETFNRSWSDVVLELGADQTAIGRRISDPDRFWLMLARLDSCLHAQGYPHDTLRKSHTYHQDRCMSRDKAPSILPHLMHAHVDYTVLTRNHLDQNIPYAYLQGLLTIHTQLSPAKSLGILVRANLADALKQVLSNSRFYFEQRLALLVWRIIQTIHFSQAERGFITDTLRSRVSLGEISRRTRTRPGLLTDPILALRRAILDPCPSDDEPWVSREAYAIVHDAHAWDLLTALAGRTDPLVAASGRLKVLLGLHQLQNGRVLEQLWSTWMNVLGSEAGRADELDALNVDRAILLLFIHSAAAHRSSRVVDGAERLLSVHPSIILERDETEGLSGPKDSLSVALGAAWVCLGTTNFTVLAARVRAAGFHFSGEFPDSYLISLAELLLAFHAPQLAWSIGQQLQTEIPVTLLEVLAFSCVQSGHITEAVSCLSDSRLEANSKRRIALLCLRESARRRVVLNRHDALLVCEVLQLGHVPFGLRHAAVWAALNAGLVRLAGLMGASWKFGSKMQRKIASRLVKSGLYPVLGVADPNAGKNVGTPTFDKLHHKNEAIRRGNKYIVSASASRRRRLGGRAQMRATLAALARLLHASEARRSTTHGRGDTRLSFAPDAVTLNILCRSLARCSSGVTSVDLRALFDLLSRSGFCGASGTGTHFGTEPDCVVGGLASSATVIAGLVARAREHLSFVRHTRPLLKTFIRAFYLRRDREAARVVVGVLKAEERTWRAEYRDVG